MRVLGDVHVERSIAAASDFTAPLQKLVSEYCWGEVWSRPGLDHQTRSFLNLALLCALNRPQKLKLHVRGALNNGITRDGSCDNSRCAVQSCPSYRRCTFKRFPCGERI